MPFSQDENKNAETKKSSIWGFLFNPRFGDDIKPLAETGRMFVGLLATLFAMNKLFPKEHPALTDPRTPLSFSEVMGTAWSRLSFTKEGIPQIAFFGAVVGCLVFTFLFLITLLLSLFIGQAHAAAGDQFFVAPDEKCELSYQWLKYLFLGENVYNSACSLNSSSFLIAPSGGSGLQKAFQSALAFYSRGVLVLAGFILLYHLTTMIAETAHTGKFMGRANQIWAPIRLVVAIGLLVPISGNAGINLGQHLVIQTARWGSALASNTWGIVVDKALGKEGIGGLDFKIPPPPQIVGIVNDVLLMNACMKGYNAFLYKSGLSDTDYLVSLQETRDSPCPGYTQSVDLSDSDVSVDLSEISSLPTCRKFEYISKNGEVLCGSVWLDADPSIDKTQPRNLKDGYALTPQLQSIATKYYNAHAKALLAVIKSDMMEEAADGVFLMEPAKAYASSKAVKEKTIAEIVKKRNDLVELYRINLSKSFKDISLDAKANAESSAFRDWTKQGWVTAGAWFNTIVRIQGALYSGAEGPLPQTKQPGLSMEYIGVWDRIGNFFEGGVKKNKQLDSFTDRTNQVLSGFRKAVTEIPFVEKGVSPQDLARTGLPSDSDAPDGGAAGDFFTIVNKIGVRSGFWSSGDGLAFEFGHSSNPLAELVYFGYSAVHTGFNILVWSGGAAIAAAVAGEAIPSIGTLAKAFASFGFFLGLLFITMGTTLAFMLPLIPFIKFFFNVLTWLIIVLEAVVAMPLWALAHLSPYGDGYAGNMAARGYQYLFSLLLRPVLLVLGLIAGFLFFFVAIHFLNLTFSVATAGSGSLGGPMGVLAKIVFSAIYAVLAYICANRCFQTISFFPENAMNWLNAASLSGKQMGDSGKTFGVMTASMAYFGEKLVPHMDTLARGVGQIAGAPKQASKEKAAAALASSQRKQDMESKAMFPEIDPLTKKETGNYAAYTPPSSPSPQGQHVWTGSAWVHPSSLSAEEAAEYKRRYDIWQSRTGKKNIT